jgi:hypothetical protein
MRACGARGQLLRGQKPSTISACTGDEAVQHRLCPQSWRRSRASGEGFG